MALRKPKRFWRPSLWASLRPFGIGGGKRLQHPNNFAEVWRAFRENKGRRAYAWRILKHGVCDGCALGTTGLRDWTQDGVHLCNIRLRLLRLNTQPAFDAALLADVGPLLALKGAALRDLGRIPVPLLRRAGEPGFRPIPWDDALALVAARMAATTPDRLAFYLTARGTPNETYYTAQKAIRALGTNNLDNAARICHAPSTHALKDALGVGASTCSYKDWIGTDLVVFIGSNVANNQPVATKYLYLARKAGTRVAVLNACREPGMERYWIPSIVESAIFGTEIATDFFLVGTGGDVAFLAGAMKHILAAGLVDPAFIADHTDGFDALAAALAAHAWPELERLAGASQADMQAFGALVGGAQRAVFVWSMGVTQHAHGEDGVRQILNLLLLRGFVGREGCGAMPIRGHSGVQGGAELGCYATAFPGGVPVDAPHAEALAAAWGFDVPSTPGLTTPEMIEAATAGALDVLYAIGGNFLDVLPDPAGVERAITTVPLRVHHDIVLTRQMLLAPVGRGEAVLLLPATTRYEVPGGVTETSTERRIIFSPEIPGPRVPEARPEGDVLLDLARRVRPDRAPHLTFATTADVRREIARIVPFYAGIERLAKAGDQFQYGGPHLCADWRFPTPTGKAHFAAVALPETRIPEGSFRVSTRRGKQFNSLVHDAKDRITGALRDAVLMARADADRLGLADGTAVALTSAHGRIIGRIHRADIARGNVQVHWPEGNVLLDPARRSPVSRIPDFNATVTVRPVDPADPADPIPPGHPVDPIPPGPR